MEQEREDLWEVHVGANSDSLPLWRRISQRSHTNAARRSHRAGQYRLERWKLRLKDITGDLLEKRCCLGGYDYAAIRDELEALQSGEVVDAPQSLSLSDRALAAPLMIPKDIPFGDIVYPIADRALIRFQESLPAYLRAVITDSALIDLQTTLLRDLSRTSHYALYEEFKLFRRLARVDEDAWLSGLADSTGPGVYEAFRKSLGCDGGSAFYRTYPVLLRLFPLILRCWEENARELLEAFYRDRPEISEMLACEWCGAISHIDLGRSDPHHGRKTVAILTLEGSRHIVFKPRSIAMEAAFMSVLTFLNRHSGQDLYRVIKTIPRHNYGWCEFVVNVPPASAQEAQIFHRRTGLLLAVLYGLRTTDCHFENLMTVDGYPIMIDLETVMHPDYDFMFENSSRRIPGSPLYQSVARVGILPSIPISNEDVDSSALGFDGQGPRFSSVGYENPGTGGMRMVTDDGARAHEIEQRQQSHIDRGLMVDMIQEGFREGYLLMLEVRDRLVTHPELTSLLDSGQCRFVPRNTRTYAWLYQRGIDASALRLGIDRSIEFESLFRAAAQSSIPNKWYALAEAEVCALENLDIPCFTVACNGRDLRTGDQIILSNVFRDSPWNLTVQHMRNLSHEDLRSQLHIIAMTFAQSPRGWAIEPSRRVTRLSPEVSSAEVVAKVTNIADKVWHARVHSIDGPGSWLGLDPIIGSGAHRLAPAGIALYQGSVGVALFFAGLHAVSKCEVSRNRSYQALEEVLITLNDKGLDSRTRFDIGDGVAGIAYGMYRIGSLLDDEGLQDRAVSLLLQVSDETLLNSEKVDVLGGLAGVLLVTEVFSRGRIQPELKKKMELCAERLMCDSNEELVDGVGWITYEGQLLPGFAHGSSGITYALGRVARVIDDTRCIAAIERGISHQHEMYNEVVGNWKELRATHKGDTLPASWCHGAVGIGIATAGLETISPEIVSVTLDRAQRVVGDCLEGEPASDSLCCGTAGILELTRVARDLDGSQELESRVIKYLCTLDTYRCVANRDSKALAVGLFNGLSGIGYQMLRSRFPEVVPSILHFD